MKVKINGYEVEGTAKDVAELLGIMDSFKAKEVAPVTPRPVYPETVPVNPWRPYTTCGHSHSYRWNKWNI